jgi:hypothetical protein
MTKAIEGIIQRAQEKAEQLLNDAATADDWDQLLIRSARITEHTLRVIRKNPVGDPQPKQPFFLQPEEEEWTPETFPFWACEPVPDECPWPLCKVLY